VVVEKQAEGCKDYDDASFKVSITKTIYVETNPEFPDDIFNMDNPLGQ